MGGMSAARANTSGTRYTIQPTTPRKRNQKRGRSHNAALYRERSRDERFLCRLKQLRAVATHNDKRATTYKPLCCLPPLSCAYSLQTLDEIPKLLRYPR